MHSGFCYLAVQMLRVAEKSLVKLNENVRICTEEGGHPWRPGFGSATG